MTRSASDEAQRRASRLARSLDAAESMSPKQEALFRLQLADILSKWTQMDDAAETASEDPAALQLQLAGERLRGVRRSISLDF